MSQKVLNHLPSEPYGYRTPTFKLDKSASGQVKVNLKSINFNLSFYNITFNNNTLRWLRRVTLSMNTNVLTYHPDTNGVTNPYIASNNKPYEQWHLCELKIPPGLYKNADDVVAAANKIFEESVKSIFNVRSESFEAYNNISIDYSKIIAGDGIVLRESILDQASFTGESAIEYISDNSFLYNYTNDENNTISVNSPNSIVNFRGVSSASIQNAVIDNPAFKNNSFTKYTEGKDTIITNSSLIKTEGEDGNFLKEFSVISSEVIGDVEDYSNNVQFDNKTISVTKGTFKTFPAYIKLDEDSERKTFKNNKYNYTRQYNSDMTIQTQTNLQFVNDSESHQQYSKIIDGIVTLRNTKFDKDLDRTISSPMAYSGYVNKTSGELRFYLADNSLDPENKYFFINISGTTNADGYIESKDIPGLIIHTSTREGEVYVTNGVNDYEIPRTDILGYYIQSFADSSKVVKFETNSFKTSTHTIGDLKEQAHSLLIDENKKTISFNLGYYYECDANGKTENIYDNEGKVDYNELYYSDGELTKNFYYCDISSEKILAVVKGYTLDEAKKAYYNYLTSPENYNILPNGEYYNNSELPIRVFRVDVQDGIITNIIVRKHNTYINNNVLYVYYDPDNTAYNSVFIENGNNINYGLVNNTVTSTNNDNTFVTSLVPYNLESQKMNDIYSVGIKNAYFLKYGTMADVNNIILKMKAEGNNNTTGQLAFTQKIFADLVDKNIVYTADSKFLKPVRYRVDITSENNTEYHQILTYTPGNDIYIIEDETSNYHKVTGFYNNVNAIIPNPFNKNIAKYNKKKVYVKNEAGSYIDISGDFVSIASDNRYEKYETYIQDSVNGTTLPVSQVTPNYIVINGERYNIFEAEQLYEKLAEFGTQENPESPLIVLDNIFIEVDTVTQYDRRLTFVKYDPESHEKKDIYICRLAGTEAEFNRLSLEQQTDKKLFILVSPGVNTYIRSIVHEINNAKSVQEYLYLDSTDGKYKNVFSNQVVTIADKGFLIDDFIWVNTNKTNNFYLIHYDGENKGKEIRPTEVTGHIVLVKDSNIDYFMFEGHKIQIFYYSKGELTKYLSNNITIDGISVYYYCEYNNVVIDQSDYIPYIYGSEFVVVEPYNSELDACLMTYNVNESKYEYDGEFYDIINQASGEKYNISNILLKHFKKHVPRNTLNNYRIEEVLTEANSDIASYKTITKYDENGLEYDRNSEHSTYLKTISFNPYTIVDKSHVVTMESAHITETGFDIEFDIPYIENTKYNIIDHETEDIMIKNTTVLKLKDSDILQTQSFGITSKTGAELLENMLQAGNNNTTDPLLPALEPNSIYVEYTKGDTAFVLGDFENKHYNRFNFNSNDRMQIKIELNSEIDPENIIGDKLYRELNGKIEELPNDNTEELPEEIPEEDVVDPEVDPEEDEEVIEGVIADGEDIPNPNNNAVDEEINEEDPEIEVDEKDPITPPENPENPDSGGNEGGNGPVLPDDIPPELVELTNKPVLYTQTLSKQNLGFGRASQGDVVIKMPAKVYYLNEANEYVESDYNSTKLVFFVKIRNIYYRCLRNDVVNGFVTIKDAIIPYDDFRDVMMSAKLITNSGITYEDVADETVRLEHVDIRIKNNDDLQRIFTVPSYKHYSRYNTRLQTLRQNNLKFANDVHYGYRVLIAPANTNVYPSSFYNDSNDYIMKKVNGITTIIPIAEGAIEFTNSYKQYTYEEPFTHITITSDCEMLYNGLFTLTLDAIKAGFMDKYNAINRTSELKTNLAVDLTVNSGSPDRVLINLLMAKAIVDGGFVKLQDANYNTCYLINEPTEEEQSRKYIKMNVITGGAFLLVRLVDSYSLKFNIRNITAIDILFKPEITSSSKIYVLKEDDGFMLYCETEPFAKIYSTYNPEEENDFSIPSDTFSEIMNRGWRIMYEVCANPYIETQYTNFSFKSTNNFLLKNQDDEIVPYIGNVPRFGPTENTIVTLEGVLCEKMSTDGSFIGKYDYTLHTFNKIAPAVVTLTGNTHLLTINGTVYQFNPKTVFGLAIAGDIYVNRGTHTKKEAYNALGLTKDVLPEGFSWKGEYVEGDNNGIKYDLYTFLGSETTGGYEIVTTYEGNGTNVKSFQLIFDNCPKLTITDPTNNDELYQTSEYMGIINMSVKGYDVNDNFNSSNMVLHSFGPEGIYYKYRFTQNPGDFEENGKCIEFYALDNIINAPIEVGKRYSLAVEEYKFTYNVSDFLLDYGMKRVLLNKDNQIVINSSINDLEEYDPDSVDDKTVIQNVNILGEQKKSFDYTLNTCEITNDAHGFYVEDNGYVSFDEIRCTNVDHVNVYYNINSGFAFYARIFIGSAAGTWTPTNPTNLEVTFNMPLTCTSLTLADEFYALDENQLITEKITGYFVSEKTKYLTFESPNVVTLPPTDIQYDAMEMHLSNVPHISVYQIVNGEEILISSSCWVYVHGTEASSIDVLNTKSSGYKLVELPEESYVMSTYRFTNNVNEIALCVKYGELSIVKPYEETTFKFVQNHASFIVRLDNPRYLAKDNIVLMDQVGNVIESSVNKFNIDYDINSEIRITSTYAGYNENGDSKFNNKDICNLTYINDKDEEVTLENIEVLYDKISKRIYNIPDLKSLVSLNVVTPVMEFCNTDGTSSGYRYVKAKINRTGENCSVMVTTHTNEIVNSPLNIWPDGDYEPITITQILISNCQLNGIQRDAECSQCDVFGHFSKTFLKFGDEYIKVVRLSTQAGALITTNPKYSANIIYHYVSTGTNAGYLVNKFHTYQLPNSVIDWCVANGPNENGEYILSNRIIINDVLYYNNFNGTYFNDETKLLETLDYDDYYSINGDNNVLRLGSILIIEGDTKIEVGDLELWEYEEFPGERQIGFELHRYEHQTGNYENLNDTLLLDLDIANHFKVENRQFLAYTVFENNGTIDYTLSSFYYIFEGDMSAHRKEYWLDRPSHYSVEDFIKPIYYNICETTSPCYYRSSAIDPSEVITIDYYEMEKMPNGFVYKLNGKIYDQVTHEELSVHYLYNVMNDEYIDVADLPDGKFYSAHNNYMLVTNIKSIDIIGYTKNSYNGIYPYVAGNNNLIYNDTPSLRGFSTVNRDQPAIVNSIDTADRLQVVRMLTKVTEPNASYYNGIPILYKILTSYDFTQSEKQDEFDVVYNKTVDPRVSPAIYKRFDSTWFYKDFKFVEDFVNGQYVKLPSDMSIITIERQGVYNVNDIRYLNNRELYPEGLLIVKYDNTEIDNSIYVLKTSLNFSKIINEFVAENVYYNYIKDGQTYYPFNVSYIISDNDYVYIPMFGGLSFKVKSILNSLNETTHLDFVTYITLNANQFATFYNQLVFKTDVYKAKADGNLFKLNNGKYEELSKYPAERYPRYTHKIDYSIIDTAIEEYYVKFSDETGVDKYAKNNFYELVNKEILKDIYEVDNTRYVLPVKVEGYSSITNRKYTFEINCLFNSDILFTNGYDMTPAEGTKFRLIALSAGDKFMFRKDFVQDFSINFRGVNYPVVDVITKEELSSFYEDIIDPAYLQNLVNTNLNSSYIQYNDEIVHSNELYKISEIKNVINQPVDFVNIGNNLNTEQIFFDTTGKVTVFEYSKSHKDTSIHNHDLFADEDNGVIYSFQSQDNKYNKPENGIGQSFIYAPFIGDFDHTYLKNTEWLDSSFLASTLNNYKHCALNSNNYYLPRAGLSETALSTINKYINALEYNPRNDTNNTFDVKALSIMSNEGNSSTIVSEVETGYEGRTLITLTHTAVEEYTEISEVPDTVVKNLPRWYINLSGGQIRIIDPSEESAMVKYDYQTKDTEEPVFLEDETYYLAFDRSVIVPESNVVPGIVNTFMNTKAYQKMFDVEITEMKEVVEVKQNIITCTEADDFIITPHEDIKYFDSFSIDISNGLATDNRIELNNVEENGGFILTSGTGQYQVNRTNVFILSNVASPTYVKLVLGDPEAKERYVEMCYEYEISRSSNIKIFPYNNNRYTILESYEPSTEDPALSRLISDKWTLVTRFYDFDYVYYNKTSLNKEPNQELIEGNNYTVNIRIYGKYYPFQGSYYINKPSTFGIPTLAHKDIYRTCYTLVNKESIASLGSEQNNIKGAYAQIFLTCFNAESNITNTMLLHRTKLDTFIDDLDGTDVIKFSELTSTNDPPNNANSFITVVSIKPVLSKETTPYFTVVSKDLLYNDQQCTIKNPYGHYIDGGENIYTNIEKKYWIKNTFEDFDGVELLSLLQNNTYIHVYRKVSDISEAEMLYYLNSESKYVPINNALLTIADKITTDMSKLEVMDDVSNNNYHHRYIKTIQASEKVGLSGLNSNYVNGLLGVFINSKAIDFPDSPDYVLEKNSDGIFYNKNHLLKYDAAHTARIAVGNGFNNTEFSNTLITNVSKGYTINEAIQEYTTSTGVMINLQENVENNSEDYYIYEYKGGVSEIHVIKTDGEVYKYIPLKYLTYIPITTEGTTSYDKMLDKFISYGEPLGRFSVNDDLQTVTYKDITSTFSIGDKDADMYLLRETVNEENSIDKNINYINIRTTFDMYPNTKCLIIDEGDQNVKKVDYAVIYNQYTEEDVDKSGRYILVESNKFISDLDPVYEGYYNYFNILTDPDTKKIITNLYKYTLEASNRGSDYVIRSGIYLANDYHDVVFKRDDEDITESVITRYVNNVLSEGHAIVLDSIRDREIQNLALRLSDNVNVYKRNIVTGEIDYSKPLSEVDYIVVLKDYTVKLDETSLSELNFVNNSIMPKNINKVFYASESLQWNNTARVYNINNRNVSTMQHLNNLSNISFKLYIDSVSKVIQLSEFIYFNQYHDNIYNSNQASTAVTSLKQVGSTELNIKNYYRTYDTFTSNVVNILRIDDESIVDNKIPSNIFESLPFDPELDGDLKYNIKNITVKNDYITSIPYVFDEENNEVGVFYNAQDQYKYDEYYYLSNISLRNSSNDTIFVNSSSDMNTNIQLNRINDGILSVDGESYINLKQYYTKPGLVQFNANKGIYERISGTANASDIQGGDQFFRYVIYDDKLSSYPININISTKGVKSSEYKDDLASTFKLSSDDVTKMDQYVHNKDIYPDTYLDYSYKSHNFRIRSGYEPLNYDINIYDNGVIYDYNTCSIVYKNRRFVLKLVSYDKEGKAVIQDLAYIPTTIRLLSVSNAYVTSGKIETYNGGNINNYFNLQNVDTEKIVRNNIQDNTNLLYDEYFSGMLSNNFSSFISQKKGQGNIVTNLVFSFPCIPVTSDIIYSKKSDYQNIIKSLDFEEDHDTFFLPPIINYSHGEYNVTKNNTKVANYKNLVDFVDDYYYNFTTEDDLLVKLGFNAPKISLDEKYYVMKDKEPVYIIKGKYYSEQIYTGPVNLQQPVKIYQTVNQNGRTLKKYQVITQAQDLLKLDSKLLGEFFYKSGFYADKGVNFTIPTSIQVKITQSNDVEKILNSSDKHSTNSLPLGEYPLITRDGQPTYNNIPQTININETITLAENNSTYLFLTSPNQRYPLVPCDCMLTFEYV